MKKELNSEKELNLLQTFNYEQRLKNLELEAKLYLNLPIYICRENPPFRLSFQDIVGEVYNAKMPCVTYSVQRDLYPGFKGDNVSLYTGKYYLLDDENGYKIVDGAPSYIDELRKHLAGYSISFIEGVRTIRTHPCSLRIETICDNVDRTKKARLD